MADYVISCESFVRLSTILVETDDPVFRTIRFDNGQAVATDRMFMSIENIGGSSGIAHIIADPMLLQKCREESVFDSKLTITVIEQMKFATAKTTLGYVHPTNCSFWPNGASDFDRWRSVVMEAAIPAQKSSGGMYWQASSIAKLASASPSGRVVFEENIDVTRPTLVRDVMDHDWLGVFQPFSRGEFFKPATLPSWMTA